MFKISVIVPVYNAEKYLKTTIESVINQSIGFENIELILVDDCSTDSSRDVILSYAEKHSNIVFYFSDSNHGRPGFGRNWGINNASSDYVLFLDNDDLLDSEICEKLYKIMQSEKSDICCCNRIINDDGDEVKYSIDSRDNQFTIFENDEILTFNNIVIHGKLYRRNFLVENNIKFSEKLSAEDFIFSTKCYSYASKLVVLSNYYGYTWYNRFSSLSHSDKSYILGTLEASYHILDFLKNENKEEYFPFVFRFTIRVLIRDCFTLNESYSVLKNILKELYDFEEKINFIIVKEQFWISFINFFVVHKLFNVATILIKILGKITRNNLIKQVFRKIKGV